MIPCTSRLALSAWLLATTCLIANAQTPFKSDPKRLAGDDLAEPAVGAQQSPAIAAGSSGSLVVWTDLRSDPGSAFGGTQSNRDIYAARLDVSGNLLDETPIVISDQFGTQTNARVAWNGTHWLVVWENQSPTQFFYATEIQAVRVATDGTVLDDPISVFTYGSSSSIEAALTANGSEWMIITRGTSAGPETNLVGVRVASDGSVVNPGGTLIEPGSGSLIFSLGVVSAGGEYLVFWSRSGLHARRLDPNLVPVAPDFTPLSLSVGSNGAGYYTTWTSGSTLVGSPMALDGALALPSGAPIVSALSLSSSPRIRWDGGQWWLAWSHAIVGLEVARVTATGVVLDPDGLEVDTANEDFMRAPDLAGLPSGGAQLVWEDSRSGGVAPQDVRTRSFSATAVSGPEQVVTVSPPAQRAPDLAPHGNGYLLVFRDEVSGESRMMLQPLDSFGNGIGEPSVLAAGSGLGLPDAAWNGSLFLVVWPDSGTILGQRVDATGALVDTEPFSVMPGYSADVAASGSNFLVTSTYMTISTQFIHMFGARVDGANGAVLDPVAVNLGQYFSRYPEVDGFGGRWISVNQRNVSHNDPFANVLARFVEADGTTTGEFFVGFGGGQPDVATSPTTALFVWRTGTDTSSDHDLVGRRMALDGTFLDAGSFVIAAEAGKQQNPSVTWTGTEFFVAWEDMRSSGAFFDERTDIYGARVTDSGVVLDPGGFPLLESDDPELQPAVSSVFGRTLVAAAEMRNDVGSYRLTLLGVGPWEGLGTSLPGSLGAPVLDGDGRLVAGSTIGFHVSNSPPFSVGLHVVGASRVDLPSAGGTLVPDPLKWFFFTTNSEGRTAWTASLTSALPPGVEVFVQSWIVDGSGPAGFTATNAIRGVAP